MTEVDASHRLWAGMSLSYNPDSDVDPPPNTFAILGHILHFPRPYNYRVCGWRPSHFAVSGVLGNWGVPVFSDQVMYLGIPDLLVRMESHPLASIGDKHIFLLIGYCMSWAWILDFRRTVSRRSIRYAAMIVPLWLRDGTESAMWTSQTSIDTALTGDPWASSWMVYCAGGLTIPQFDLSPVSDEIRTLVDCYRLVWQECGGDPEGSRVTHSIPNSLGKVTVITTGWGAQYSRRSHIPFFSTDSLYGNSASWPKCVSTGLQPTPAEKIAILGGHVGLLGEEIILYQRDWMTPRVYRCGIVRHILRAARNHFQRNLPSASIHGRSGGHPPVGKTHDFPPR